MDGIVKINIILKNYLKLYRLRKSGSTQEYLNPSLFSNSNKFIANK